MPPSPCPQRKRRERENSRAKWAGRERRNGRDRRGGERGKGQARCARAISDVLPLHPSLPIALGFVCGSCSKCGSRHIAVRIH
eukprot:7152338-Pyramimonas_sp.AAC.1